MNSQVVIRLQIGWALVLLATSIAQSSRPPSLAQRLRDSYTINPNVNPLFTKCVFDGDPLPSISWLFNSTILPSSQQQTGPFYSTDRGALNLSKATPGRHSGNYTCVGTNRFGTASESTVIIIVTRQEDFPIWARWWMFFVYAVTLWLIITVCLMLYYVYRRCTTKEKRKRPPTSAVNTDEYICYDNELDPSPRYTFANPNADDEPPSAPVNPTTFCDHPTLEATGYLNPAFNQTMPYYN